MVTKATRSSTRTPVKATKATTTRKPRTKAPAQDAAELEANSEIAAALSGTFNPSAFLNDLKALCDRYLAGTAVSDDIPAVATDDEPDEQTREDREDEISKWTVRQLRNALNALKDDKGDPVFDAADINKEKDKAVLIENLLAVEFGDDDDSDDDADDDEDQDDDAEADDDEDDDDSDEDDEDETVDKATLLKLSLAQLKKLAVEEYEIDAADVKGQDKDSIADMIIEAAGGDEADDADDDDDDDADDDEDAPAAGEDEHYTEEELLDMPIRELRTLCDDNGIKYTAAVGKDKVKLVAKIMAA